MINSIIIKRYFLLLILALAIFSFDKDDYKKENIFLGIDSLTEGAGGTTYRDFFYKDSLPPKLGYVSIDYKSTKDYQVSVFMTENMKWLPPEMDYSSYPKKFSLDGKGVFTNKGKADRCAFNISNLHSYKKVGLYYLKQPEGGSFLLYASNIGVSSEKKKVFTKSKKFEIGYTEIETEVSDRFNIDSIFGKVVVFGLNFKNDSLKTNVVNTFAKGGVKLNDIVSLDKKFRRAWFKTLKPTTYILNAGMNDRKTIEPTIFKENLEGFINDLNYSVPKCKIILVEPSESKDYSETYMNSYRRIRQELSIKKKNVYYYSIPKSVGDYTFFDKNGMMLDKVHPNKKGNEAIGKSLYEFFLTIK